MIYIKNNVLRMISGLIIVDILVLIGLLNWDYYSFGLFFVPQIVISFLNLMYDKGQLFDYIMSKRKEILKKYYILGKYTSWERKVLKASRENDDDLLKIASRKAILLNLVPLLVPLNIIIFLYALEVFNL